MRDLSVMSIEQRRQVAQEIIEKVIRNHEPSRVLSVDGVMAKITDADLLGNAAPEQFLNLIDAKLRVCTKIIEGTS